MGFELATTIIFILAGIAAALLRLDYARDIFLGPLLDTFQKKHQDDELQRRLEEALKRRNAQSYRTKRAADRAHSRRSAPPALTIARVLQQEDRWIVQIRNAGGSLLDIRAEAQTAVQVHPTNLGANQTGQLIFRNVPPNATTLPFALHYTDAEGQSHAAGWKLDLANGRLLPA